jgi:hypothetical protein
MSRLSSDKAFDSSSKSLLSRMGLKANTADANRPLLLKNDDNFLEHRKVLVQRWKDNIRSKGLDVSGHGDEDKEEEVSLKWKIICVLFWWDNSAQCWSTLGTFVRKHHVHHIGTERLYWILRLLARLWRPRVVSGTGY